MFKFLKEKLKGAIDRIVHKVEQEAPKEEIEVKEVIEEKKEIKKKEKVKEKKSKKPVTPKVKEEIREPEEVKVIEEKQEIKEEPKQDQEAKHSFFDFLKKKPKEEEKEQKLEVEAQEEKKEKHEKKSLFESIKEKVTTKIISEKQFDDIFWDLEVTLLENNVAVEVIEKIKKDLKKDLTSRPIKRDKITQEIIGSLRKSISDLFNVSPVDVLKSIKAKQQKPYVIAFVGINGSGKTTTIAKFGSMLLSQKISCVFAACDTFRAAAIHQLEEHGQKLGIKVIKHDYGADAAAVAFDAISHAKAKNIDVVLIDTAGRLHSNINLIDELKKIVRVAKPDLKIFVGESITGNDCVIQAEEFNKSIGLDGIILAKADIDEKGGAAISVSYVTGKPILYVGTGQNYEDLEIFTKEKIIKNIGLS